MLRSFEKTRITNALMVCGFELQQGAYFNTAFLYKLRTADHSLYFTLSSYDTLGSLKERIMDCAWRSRMFNKKTKLEVITLANKVEAAYEQEAFRDPTGNSNPSK